MRSVAPPFRPLGLLWACSMRRRQARFWAWGALGTVLCSPVSPSLPTLVPEAPLGLSGASVPAVPPLWALGGTGGGVGGEFSGCSSLPTFVLLFVGACTMRARC